MIVQKTANLAFAHAVIVLIACSSKLSKITEVRALAHLVMSKADPAGALILGFRFRYFIGRPRRFPANSTMGALPVGRRMIVVNSVKLR
jgi:hypothetical protein